MTEKKRLALWKTKRFPFLPPVRARGNQVFGNQFVFRRQGSAETGKPKAPSGLSSKTQSQDRLPGRQPYGSAPLREDLTEWRNAQTVRLIDRKPEVPERNKGANRSSPAQRCVMAPISTRTTFGLLLPQSAFSSAGHTACGRCGRPGFLIGSIAFPPGISVVRATPKRGRQRVARPLSTFALPRGAPAPEIGGSLSPPAALPCGAPLRRAGRGTREAKPRIAVSQPDAGNPFRSASCAAFRKSLRPRRRGLRPLRDRRWSCRNHVTL